MIYWSKVCKIIAHKVVKSLEQKHVCLFGEWYLKKNKFHVTDVFGKVKTAFLFAYLYFSRQNQKNFRMKEQFEYLIKAVWNVLYWTFENFVGFKAPTLLTGPPLSLLKYTTVNQPGHIVHILAITITANYLRPDHTIVFSNMTALLYLYIKWKSSFQHLFSFHSSNPSFLSFLHIVVPIATSLFE